MTDRIRLNEGNRRWWTLASMCFALFMIMLDNTVVNVALPSIQKDLGASLPALEWTVNIYTLTFAVLLVTGGRLGDIFGRRRMFLFGVVVFAVSSAAIGLAPTQEWLPPPPRADAGVARRRPSDPGHRRRVHDARHPLDHLEHLPARRARARDRHLGRRVGARAGARAGRRRRAHRGRPVAGGFFPDPAGRDRRGRGDAVRHAGVARPDGRPQRRLPGHRRALGGPHLPGAGAGR